MTPTREQFKELMAIIKNAQEKEDKVNDAFKPYGMMSKHKMCPFTSLPGGQL